MNKYSREELIEAINRQKEAVKEAAVHYNNSVYEAKRYVEILEELAANLKDETAEIEDSQVSLSARKKVLAQLEAQLAKLNNVERKRK
jgi:coenzyme F420-reducing hydrogenase delta subunit